MTTAKDVYRQRPSQDETDEVLASRELAALATLNEDGSIHLSYVLFLYTNGRA